jgi:ParB family chromosome partitioning protein
MGPELQPVAARIEQEGGVVLAPFRDPLGRHALLMAAFPIARVQPTPFQRDLSETHHKRLAEVIDRIEWYLDPIIAVPAPTEGFWTPNGYHRLEAMRRLGAQSITALVVPDRGLTRRILALNTEKAPNLKERALEVIRLYRTLLKEEPGRAESDFAFILEDASLVTVGLAYERDMRFPAGAYHPVLRRVEAFADAPLKSALALHERRAELLIDLERKVADAVARLKAKGLESPYLRSSVVARINPLRFVKGELPPPEKVLATMRDRAARFNVEKVKQQDLAGGFAPVADED